MQRGLVLNNPGNIVKSESWWRGQIVSDDSRFVAFSDMRYGIRAVHKLLVNYQRLHGLETVAGIIGRYAPEFENPTGAYIKYVAQYARISPTEKIDLATDVELRSVIVMAIINFEQGSKNHTIQLSDVREHSDYA